MMRMYKKWVEQREHSKRHFTMPLVAATLILTLTGTAHSEECYLNGKGFFYSARVCLGERCSPIKQTIVLLGERAMLMYKAEQPTGLAFTFGKTISMSRDTLNKSEAGSGPLPPGATREVATTAASKSGDTFEFIQQRELFSGDVNISSYHHVVRIRLKSCSQCELDEYEISGHVDGRQIVSRADGMLCRIAPYQGVYEKPATQ